MLKNCDVCDTQFDVFEEGNVSDYKTALCGKCWIIELTNRGIIKEAK